MLANGDGVRMPSGDEVAFQLADGSEMRAQTSELLDETALKAGLGRLISSWKTLRGYNTPLNSAELAEMQRLYHRMADSVGKLAADQSCEESEVITAVLRALVNSIEDNLGS